MKIFWFDLFCGAGGVTTGIHFAGQEVVACVNHDKLAIKSHKLNHPNCIHFIENIKNPIISYQLGCMADVSLPMDQMFSLAKESGLNFTWIDHHASAIKEYSEFVQQDPAFRKGAINAVLKEGVAACEIAWEYFFPNKPMPITIKLLGEYDTWRNKDKERWENKILPFQYGMRNICNSLDTFPMYMIDIDKVEAHHVTDIIHDGETIISYQEKQNEMHCRLSSFETGFEGLRAICLNTAVFNSQTFKSVYDEEKHDIMIPFQFKGKSWTISLYTTKDIDCSEIARSRGGGGHKKAAGFQTNDIKSVFSFIN